MKKINILFTAAALLVFAAACAPSTYDLGAVDLSSSDLKEGEAFSVWKDVGNPNKVFMKNLFDPAYQHFWVHPQGRSQDDELSIIIPFPGDYRFTFGVLTRGGIVEAEPYTVNINSIDEEYISGELWRLVAGGYGGSKTWVLDLDADGKSVYWLGPLYFFGADDWWGTISPDGNGEPLGDNSWSWEADWPSNSWIMPAMNYGEMTFYLIDSPDLIVDQKSMNRTETGTFMINEGDYSITLNGATIIHDKDRDGDLLWSEVRICSVSENTMQLGAFLPADNPSDEQLIVYNFVTKEYYEANK